MIRALVILAAVASGPAAAADRVLAVGGAVTEIVYALGAGDKLVARDTTSSYPEQAQALPDVGYMRALSPEGVLSVAPDLIVAVEGAGPPETLEVLHSADIELVTVPEGYDAEAIARKIAVVGDALDLQPEAAALSAKVRAEVEAASATAQGRAEGQNRRVMFVLSTQGGRILASGTGTAADAVIALAGAQNAFSEFEGYKPLTDEAILKAAPDVILMMDRGGDHSQSDADLLAMPAIAQTPAGLEGEIVRMPGLYLLGFGPRTASAVSDLSDHLYGS
ncbi:MAG: ABC transporter substrate-binding protein [Pseudomonadota bacterium]